MSGDDTTVFVRFKTKLPPQYVITDDPISVPWNLKRLGLSQVINHLLGSTKNPTPFDILIDKSFLRTSLRKYIALHDLQEEQVIELEYVLALDSETQDSLPHKDWVSALDKRQDLPSRNFLFSGSYDNNVSLWVLSGEPKSHSEPILQLEGHTGPIKTVSAVGKSDKVTVVSGSQDQVLKVWEVSLQKSSGKCLYTLAGHTGSIEDCDIHSDGNLIVSGSWDGSVKLWVLSNEDDDTTAQETEGDRKRRKVETTYKLKKARTTMTGHKQPVSGVQWITENEVVSSSWDHSLRIWDAETGANTLALNGNSAVYGVSSFKDRSLFVTAHADFTVRIWDQRQSGSQLYTVLTSHKDWVSSVACHPTDENLFLSTSYDKTVKVWDTRSTTPLQTLAAHDDKVLCGSWCSSEIFASGGADNKLHTHKRT